MLFQALCGLPGRPKPSCASVRSVIAQRIFSATARVSSSGEVDLESWRNLTDDELRARLCELPGVGAKVANCVMLFAYERLRAFPIDVWIERVLRQKYFPRPTESDRRKIAHLLRELLRRTRRVCPAISVSSCAEDNRPRAHFDEHGVLDLAPAEANVPGCRDDVRFVPGIHDATFGRFDKNE